VGKRRDLRKAIKPALALAASLLIGLLVGRAFDSTSEETVVLAASGTATWTPVRGNQQELRLRVNSPLDGFLVAVALAPNTTPKVRPGLGIGDFEALKGKPSEHAVLPANTTRVVFVVTTTPAGESIRQLIDDSPPQRYQPEDHAALRNDLQRYLEDKGHRKMAFGDLDIAP
jgi:hypothetical protein